MSGTNIHEEQSLGKVYDSQLMKRLLHYVKPYRWMVISSILLLLVITATDLAGPYLIKVAIDDHINGLGKPMAVFEKGEAPKEGIEFQGKVYIRQSELKDLSAIKSEAQIIEIDKKHYLIQGNLSPNVKNPALTHVEGNQYLLTDQGIPAQLLSRDELKEFQRKDISAVKVIALLYLGILVLSFILNYSQTRILQTTGQKIIYDLRQHLFSHLQKLSLSFFDRNPVGRLVTRATNDVESLNEMFTSVLVNLFKDFFILIGIMIIMLNLNVKLALICFLTLPLIIGVSIIYRNVARNAFRQVRIKLARINAALAENLSGMRIVQIFKREKQQFDQFNEINKDHFRSNLKELQASSIFRPLMDLIYSIGLALLIWFGGHEVLGGAVQFGVLYAFIDYLGRFFQPINDLTEKYTIMQSAMASSERIFQLLDQEPAIKNAEAPVHVERLKGEIRFNHVWFAYNPGEWILKDISFSIQPGEMVAFVGATGAGKSSIINLLSRFYDIQKGEITIDGVDIRNYDLNQLRRNIGVVLQDVFLFSGDIRSNIRLNNRHISDEEIMEVAKHVNAHSFISKLPNQYDEIVQERGSTLSAGQRQLLSFARTLAFNPSILVLDEATSNIDTETELLIQDAMKKLTQNRTTIVVAHRLSTIQHADKIIVLHKGEIKEMGNHQELLAKKGLYYKLYELQYKENFKEQLAYGATAQA